MGKITWINEIIDWLRDTLGALVEWALEKLEQLLTNVANWVRDKIMQICEKLLVDVAEGVADGVEESGEIE